MRKTLLSVCFALCAMLALPLAAQTPGVIDFDGLPAGTQVSEIAINGPDGVLGTAGVLGTNPLLPGDNGALIFDSANPPGVDFDLGSPNTTCGPPGESGGPGMGGAGTVGGANPNCDPLFNILIVGEDLIDDDDDGLVDIPNDVDELGTMVEFDFSSLGTVTVLSLKILDVEIAQGEAPATIFLFDSGDGLLGAFDIGDIGCNGVKDILTGDEGIGTAGVARMEVLLNGSGAIADIQLLVEEGNGDPCDDDTTPPELICEIKRVGCWGLKKVCIDAFDDGGGEVIVEAGFDLGCGFVPVEDGQILKAFCNSWKCGAWLWCWNILILKSPDPIVFTATATDECGNTSTCEIVLCDGDGKGGKGGKRGKRGKRGGKGGKGGGHHDDDDDDDGGYDD